MQLKIVRTVLRVEWHSFTLSKIHSTGSFNILYTGSGYFDRGSRGEHRSVRLELEVLGAREVQMAAV